MKVFLRSTILALFFLTNAIYAADSKSNRKDNVVSFGVKGGVGWPAITSPIFIVIPGEKWSVGLDSIQPYLGSASQVGDGKTQ